MLELDDDDFSEDAVPDPEPAPKPKPKSSGGSVNMLAAAMLAVGDILEPEKTDVEIVQTNDDPLPDDLGYTIDFGDLPPLD